MEKNEIFQKLFSQKSKLIVIYGNECTDTHGDAFISIYYNDAIRELKAKNVSPTFAGFVGNAFFITLMMPHTCLCYLHQHVLLENGDIESKDINK